MLQAFLVTAMILVGAPAFAQNPQSASPNNPTVPIAPPNAPSPPPERLDPSLEQPAPANGRGNMSDRLSQQKGTITPPNVDPGMTVAPPRDGTLTTPVIPPPGSPGGNPLVVPK